MSACWRSASLGLGCLRSLSEGLKRLFVLSPVNIDICSVEFIQLHQIDPFDERDVSITP